MKIFIFFIAAFGNAKTNKNDNSSRFVSNMNPHVMWAYSHVVMSVIIVYLFASHALLLIHYERNYLKNNLDSLLRANFFNCLILTNTLLAMIYH